MKIPAEGPASDGARCYDLAQASLREIVIRSGAMLPASGSAVEERWFQEQWTGAARLNPDGTPDTRTLETVRG